MKSMKTYQNKESIENIGDTQNDPNFQSKQMHLLNSIFFIKFKQNILKKENRPNS